jgi:hypothetical protein
VIIEVIFERVRAVIAPELPSRLESTFLWPTTALAHDFRRRFRTRGIVHECHIVDGEPVPRDAALIVSGVDLSARLDDETRRIEHRAVRYWAGDHEIAYPEVLLRGKAIVVEVHQAFT